MALRTIMIFPKFQNMKIIDAIRSEYDPLSKLVRPHITLVFPFDLELSDEELSIFLDNRLCGVRPFTISLQGISRYEDKYGNYLLLDVNEGNDQLSDIHCKLCTGELKKLNSGSMYIPHMTIGKLKTLEDLSRAYDKVKGLEVEFKTVIDAICVEVIGENEESTIIIEKRLK